MDIKSSNIHFDGTQITLAQIELNNYQLDDFDTYCMGIAKRYYNLIKQRKYDYNKTLLAHQGLKMSIPTNTFV